MAYTILLYVTRKPTVSTEFFKDYWENKHIPLLQSLTGPLFPLHTRRYFARVERLGFGGPANKDHPPLLLRGNPEDVDCDGIAELTFQSEQKFYEFYRTVHQTDVAAKLAEDEEQFLDVSKLRAVVIGDTFTTQPEST